MSATKQKAVITVSVMPKPGSGAPELQAQPTAPTSLADMLQLQLDYGGPDSRYTLEFSVNGKVKPARFVSNMLNPAMHFKAKDQSAA